MGKVLLAIDGISHSRKVFRYALQLCQWIKAEMEIVHVISPQSYRDYIERVQKGAGKARRSLQNTFAAAAFAEAGEHKTAAQIMAEAEKNGNRLLCESEKAGVHCRVTFKSGNPRKEITDFVKKHRDIVLTIYDEASEDPDPAEGGTAKTSHRKLLAKLKVPLVVIRR